MSSASKYRKNRNKNPNEVAIAKVSAYCSIILFVLIIINLFIAFVIQSRELPIGTVRIIILFVVHVSIYFLAPYIYYKITAFISVFSFYVAFIIFPLLPLGSIPVQDLILLFFIFHVISVIPYLVYKIDEDRYWIISWLVIMFINFVYSFNYILGRIEGSEDNHFTEMFRLDPMLVVAHIGSLIFLQCIIYSYRKTNQKQQNAIEEMNDTLSSNINTVNIQRDQLLEQNEEMIQLQEELKSTNEQLELKVRQRTEELEEQNKLLVQYGFMNSHILRAPIATLKGLYEVSKMTKEPKDLKQVQKHIERTIQELERASKSLNEVIAKKDPILLKEIEDRIKQIYGDPEEYF